MKRTKKPSGKGLLIASVVLLGAVLLCLVGGMFISLPARAEELFGPPQPGLPLRKLYSQSLILVLAKEQLDEPLAPPATDYLFPIRAGDSLEEILTGLIALGLVEHAQAFRAYLIYSGLDTRIQPGEYRFPAGLTELELADLLGNPQSAATTLTILAGWRAEEIGASLLDLGFQISQADFMAAVHAAKKEGYLFPGSYPLGRELTAEELVEVLYQNFIANVSPDLETGWQDQGLNLDQAVILASIIEREAVLDQEMPQIASVFLNRLRNGLNLAADPTVQYALGYSAEQGSWWTNPLTLEDLKYPSPYNTYEQRGLPPGPISNPGLEALQAVAFPADTQFLYFRAACDGSGSHSFAVTFEEHLANACE